MTDQWGSLADSDAVRSLREKAYRERRPSSAAMFGEAQASYEAAIAQARVERAASDARIARLKHAAELERLGRYDEAAEIVASIRKEQEEGP